MPLSETSNLPNQAAILGQNTANGDGIVGEGRRGVVGTSSDFQGVYGLSQTNAGVVGEAAQFHGVYGVSHAVHNGGVYGTNDAGGFGVIGVCPNGVGVQGDSSGGEALVGVSQTGRGVHGSSTSWQGVYGYSQLNAGIVGESAQFHAVFGISHNVNNAGVFGTNEAGGFAAVFDGRVAVSGDCTLNQVWVNGDCNLVNADCAEEFTVFPMDAGANGLYGKTREKIGMNSEPKNVARSAVSCIPIASDLDGIFLLKHWIENRLLGKPGKESRPSAGLYQG